MEFRILGPLEVVDEGRPIAIRRGKEQALLIYLLLHANEVVPSGRLIDELWGERPPPTAPKILQNAVSHLRKQLGDGRLVTRGPGYVLRVDEDELDVQRFERLAKGGHSAEALALWRGSPLLDLHEERFADDVRRRLEEQRAAVLENRIEDDLAAGRHGELVPALEQLVNEHPLRERLQGQLMRALYGAGRQADALEAYRQARRTLSDELGLEPGPELQELERKILTQDPSLAPGTPRLRPARQAVKPRPRLALLGLVGAVLVGAAAFGLVHALGGDAPLVATPNSLAVIDPGRNRLVKVVPVGEIPRGVAVGRDFVWVANTVGGTVTQIDRRTMKVVQVIGTGAQPTDVVEAYGGVWVATGVDNGLVHLDASTGGNRGTTPLSSDPNASAHAITAGSNALWVASGDRVVRVDASTGRRKAVCCFLGVNDVAAGDNAIWFVDVSEFVGRVSSTTLRVNRSANLGVIPSALTFAFGAAWVALPDPSKPRLALWRVDPQTMRVTQTTSIGPAHTYAPSLELTAGAGSLWVTDYDTGTVVRVNPASGQIISTIKIGGHPYGIAFGGDRIWVTVS